MCVYTHIIHIYHFSKNRLPRRSSGSNLWKNQRQNLSKSYKTPMNCEVVINENNEVSLAG